MKSEEQRQSSIFNHVEEFVKRPCIGLEKPKQNQRGDVTLCDASPTSSVGLA